MLGWRWVFACLVIVAAITLAAAAWLLPKQNPDPAVFHLRPCRSSRNFSGIIRHPQFYTYAFTSAIASAASTPISAARPMWYMELFAREREDLWLDLRHHRLLDLITASQINNLLLRHTSEQIIRGALVWPRVRWPSCW